MRIRTPHFPKDALVLSCLVFIGIASVGCQAVRSSGAAPLSAGHVGPAATNSPASVALPGWTLLFDDEFNGSSVDPSKWTVVDSNAPSVDPCCKGWGNQTFLPENVVEKDGQLQIITKAQSVDGHPYTSGALMTRNTLQFTYGRIDIRAKLPDTAGLWPAFWLLRAPNAQGQYLPYYEADFMEAWMGDPYQVFGYFHYGQSQVTCSVTNGTFTNQFHTYTLIWSPGKFQWEVDGQAACIDTTDVPNVPMYLIIDTAIDGIDQHVDNTTRLPQTLVVDYVRVWQQTR